MILPWNNNLCKYYNMMLLKCFHLFLHFLAFFYNIVISAALKWNCLITLKYSSYYLKGKKMPSFVLYMTNFQSKQFDSLKCQMVARKFFMVLSFLNITRASAFYRCSIFQSMTIIISDTLALVSGKPLQLTSGFWHQACFLRQKICYLCIIFWPELENIWIYVFKILSSNQYL